jgi:hypothetical protein
MIELALILPGTAATSGGLLQRRNQDRMVVVARTASTPTAVDFDAILDRIHAETSSTTYRLAVPRSEPESIDTTPIRRFILKAPIKFLGKGTQPEIDDDDGLVFFDE